ncbi:ferritin-like domain-containing protein [Moorena producens JHB]|uniref:Ferritin-like domain-containing protein n=1 Tax=Moorena producens (strain JHB) TaxID=1454205 RepID=A0A1D9G3C6_MOOP1|nr:ferritin-like domain-containing protein [Moorena producens]AOY82113.2 ferritin-like domain-containing protein [Moorena producens JHB]
MTKTYEIPLEVLVCQPPSEAAIATLKLAKLPLSFEIERNPRDEAALLLTVAAEVEHALMVQYLYAAYSVRDDQTNHETKGRVRSLYQRLAQLAREEMGHLMTVQNLLHLIGAPLNFEREDSPFESKLYPFRFKLEPLSKQSLAKYITAERPAEQGEIDNETWQRLLYIAKIARRANDGRPIQHVGAIYERLIQLFGNAEEGLKDQDFHTDRIDLQGTWDDWGYDEGLGSNDKSESRRVYVDTFEGSHPTTLRKEAVKALEIIAEQGEGYGSTVDSHFERFFQLYKDFEKLKNEGVEFVWPVATNPSTTPPRPILGKRNLDDYIRAAFEERGYIANCCARNWGQLFNLRYRLLLAFLIHFLKITGRRYVSSGPDKGDRTPRGLLLLWAFDEMRHLKKIAQKMVRLPLKLYYNGVTAGPPFQLPYTLDLPDLERDRWRVHLDVVKASLTLVEKALQDDGSPDQKDPFLEDLQRSDRGRASILEALAAGQSIPTHARTESFQKVARILEEAVRGFSIDAHSNFWAGINREQFVQLHMFNRPFLRRNEDDCNLTAEGSELVSRLESSSKTGKMPRYRPLVDSSRQEFVREWIDAQAPDNEPPGQIGVHHEREPNLEPLPSWEQFRKSERVGYRSDIRPLFRDFDLETLQRLDGIDLNDVENVRANGEELRERLNEGSLPYDACWSDERIDLFERWIDSGMEN